MWRIPASSWIQSTPTSLDLHGCLQRVVCGKPSQQQVQVLGAS